MSTKNDYSDAKRHDDLMDDFFSLGSTPKKRKKKAPKILTQDSSPNILFEHLSADNKPAEVLAKSPKTPGSESAGSEDSIIILSDDKTTNVEPQRNKTRSETLASSVTEKDTSATVDSDTSEDNQDDLDLYDDIVQSVSSAPRAQDSIGYAFSDNNEKDRLYLIRVIPKLYSGTVIDFTTKGTKAFEKILDSIVQHYQAKKFFPQKLNGSDLALFWVEGKRQVENFYKPSTLRILPPSPAELVYIGDKGHTKISCLVIPKSEAPNAFSKYEELKLSYFTFDTPEQDGVILEEIGEPTTTEFPQIFEAEDRDESKDKFIIGVRGADNKKVEIEVSKETKIEELLWKYVEIKKMEKEKIDKSNIRLLFDDEDLNLDDIVGNTELEEDFEVQIVF